MKKGGENWKIKPSYQPYVIRRNERRKKKMGRCEKKWEAEKQRKTAAQGGISSDSKFAA